MPGTRRRQANINTSGLIPFQPGQSGNAGRTRDKNWSYRGMLKLCRVNSGDAVRTLLACMNDPSAPWPARVVAANSILDRGWGRPKEHLQVDGADGMNVMIVTGVPRPDDQQDGDATIIVADDTTYTIEYDAPDDEAVP